MINQRQQDGLLHDAPVMSRNIAKNCPRTVYCVVCKGILSWRLPSLRRARACQKEGFRLALCLCIKEESLAEVTIAECKPVVLSTMER